MKAIYKPLYKIYLTKVKNPISYTYFYYKITGRNMDKKQTLEEIINLEPTRFSYNLHSKNPEKFITNKGLYNRIKDAVKLGKSFEAFIKETNLKPFKTTEYAFYLLKMKEQKKTPYSFYLFNKWRKTMSLSYLLKWENKTGDRTIKSWYEEEYLKEMKRKKRNPYSLGAIQKLYHLGKKALLNRNRDEEVKKKNSLRKGKETKPLTEREKKNIAFYIKNGYTYKEMKENFGIPTHRVERYIRSL